MLDTDSELVEFEKDNTLNTSTDSVYSVMGIIAKMQLIADRTVLLGEVRGDLVQVTEQANVDLKALAAFDLSKDNRYNDVRDYYAVINNCNFFLNRVDTALERRGRKLYTQEFAAVKTFRAWTYLQMVTAYGAVPLVLEPVMTEIAAREAMNQEKKGIVDVCNYFISDLTPYADVDFPNYGNINDLPSEDFFIPTKVLLGDLCLWAGRYEEAARWYHDFLADKDDPVYTGIAACQWRTPDFAKAYPSTTISSLDVMSYIPMESRVFDGTVSDLANIFESTEENNYYFQLEPSTAMRNISAAQNYCYLQVNDTYNDTIYVPHTGLQKDIYAGDLRLNGNFDQTAFARDIYSEYSDKVQTITKIRENRVVTTHRQMIYLHFAEALNRCGLPQSAMCILKYGLTNENATLYVDSLERDKAGSLIDFDSNIFVAGNVDGRNTLAIHARGCGASHADSTYVLPQPATALASRQDTIDYQVERVEDLIVTEMALEGAFDGSRYYDLMRVALRRGDASYLAQPISVRRGEEDATLKALLMNKENWYLPLK